jgi:phosphohistidine phosphatase
MSEPVRILILVRHAKSSWADESLPDHDRPLNARGERDAPRMARRLKKRGPIPQRIVSSSARRALDTARTFAEVLGMDAEEVDVRSEIYGAGVHEIVELIRGLGDGLQRVMLVGHNPRLSALAHHLSSAVRAELPTCAVITLEMEGRGWEDAGEGTFRLLDLDFPKKKEK